VVLVGAHDPFGLHHSSGSVIIGTTILSFIFFYYEITVACWVEVFEPPQF
jgi:hypothetical protein